MRFVSIGIAAALALSSTLAVAQSAGTSVDGSSTTRSTTTGSTSNGTTGLGTGAGSGPAATPSYLNPSGNSLINPSPSGSTLTQPPAYAAPGMPAPAPR